MENVLGWPPRLAVATASPEERRRYVYAFNLAWFLHPTLEIASKIATYSLVGLPETFAAQSRRAEYTPRGPFRARVSLEVDHLLQRRVFAASEEFERRRETSREITREDLTVYFVKEAVRVAMKYASFQVMVSVGRILHSYRTKDVMNMYGTIAPNRSAKKNDDQCREWKKTLMDHLEDRFGRYISLTTGSRGERRFVTVDDRKILSLAIDCLRRFVPSHTCHVVPNNCSVVAPDLLNYNGPPDGEHSTELLRLHASICPVCFLSLTKAWKLDSPDHCFSIPKFSLPPLYSDSSGDRRTPPELTDEDVDGALDEVAEEQQRRRRTSPATLRVLVGGVERSTLDLTGSERVSIALAHEEEVIDLVSEDGDVLVRHLMTYGDDKFPAAMTTEYKIAGLSLCIVEERREHSPTPILEIRRNAQAIVDRGHSSPDCDVSPGTEERPYFLLADKIGFGKSYAVTAWLDGIAKRQQPTLMAMLRVVARLRQVWVKKACWSNTRDWVPNMLAEDRPRAFLWYCMSDERSALILAGKLKEQGIESWAENWDTGPDVARYLHIQEYLKHCSCCVVIVGVSSRVPWQFLETLAAPGLRKAEGQGGLSVIPVLLPGVKDDLTEALPPILAVQPAVRFREIIEDRETLHRLIYSARESNFSNSRPGAAAREIITSSAWVLGLSKGSQAVDISRADAVASRLRELAGDPQVTIKGLAAGSIGLAVSSSPQALSRLKAMLRAGQILQILEMTVEGIWPQSGGKFVGEDERFQVVRQLFYQASRVPKSERENFVAEACKEDAELAISIRGLLEASERSTSELSAARGSLEYTMSPKPHIENYELLEPCLEGGMGLVYKARRADGRFDQVVAIKVMRPEFRNNPIVVKRFQMEIRLLAGLKHPNIPGIVDAGDLDDRSPYAVMDWINGKALSEYCIDLDVRKRIELFRQIARAVGYLHSCAVVHRDMKPGNILVSPDGVPKLLDFGIAKVVGPLAVHFTAINEIVGTLGWAAPEQLCGDEIGFPCDVYSLGVMLYELITGQRPGANIVRPSTVAPRGYPKRLDAVLLTALAKRPETRYPTANAFVGALDQALAHRSLRPAIVAAAVLVLSGSGIGWWDYQHRQVSTDTRSPSTVEPLRKPDGGSSGPPLPKHPYEAPPLKAEATKRGLGMASTYMKNLMYPEACRQYIEAGEANHLRGKAAELFRDAKSDYEEGRFKEAALKFRELFTDR